MFPSQFPQSLLSLFPFELSVNLFLFQQHNNLSIEEWQLKKQLQYFRIPYAVLVSYQQVKAVLAQYESNGKINLVVVLGDWAQQQMKGLFVYQRAKGMGNRNGEDKDKGRLKKYLHSPQQVIGIYNYYANTHYYNGIKLKNVKSLKVKLEQRQTTQYYKRIIILKPNFKNIQYRRFYNILKKAQINNIHLVHNQNRIDQLIEDSAVLLILQQEYQNKQINSQHRKVVQLLFLKKQKKPKLKVHIAAFIPIPPPRFHSQSNSSSPLSPLSFSFSLLNLSPYVIFETNSTLKMLDFLIDAGFYELKRQKNMYKQYMKLLMESRKTEIEEIMADINKNNQTQKWNEYEYEYEDQDQDQDRNENIKQNKYKNNYNNLSIS